MKEIDLKVFLKINYIWHIFCGISRIYLVKKSKHISVRYFTSAHLLTDKSLLALHTDPQQSYRPWFQYGILLLSIASEMINNIYFCTFCV